MTGIQSREERVERYEEMSTEERREVVQKAIETAVWAEDNGQLDLRDLCLDRLAAMDDVVDGNAGDLV